MALVVALVALQAARSIAIPTVLAALAALILAPAARRLERWRAPRSLAAAAIVFGALCAAGGGFYALAPTAETWNDRAPQILRDLERRARQINRDVARSVGADAPRTPAEADKEGDGAVEQIVDSGQRLIADLAIGAPGLMVSAGYWAFLTFFLLRDRGMLSRQIIRLGPNDVVRRALGRGLRDVRTDVARYLIAVTAINTLLGLAVAASFYLIGVPNAAVWGMAAGLLNFMPFIGMAIMVVVAAGVGLVSFEDPLLAFAPVIALLVLNAIEGQIVTPLVIGARMRLSSLAIFVAIAFGAWLWGPAGALIATPSLIVFTALFTRLASSRPPGQRSGG